jgi:imidazolonepropionase-like amidohydrolase
MKARGTCFVPTYTTVVDLSEGGGDYDSPLLRLRGMHMLPQLAAAIKAAIALGIPTITGVDTPYNAESTSRVALEVMYFAQFGMSPMDAIRAATSANAACLGIGQRTGTLAPGMEADVIVLERNPLDDIRAVQDVVMVIADGRVALKRIPFRLP